MSRVFMVILALLWSVPLHAQNTPTISQWIAIFQEVQQHPVFRELKVIFAKTPAENVDYCPASRPPESFGKTGPASDPRGATTAALPPFVTCRRVEASTFLPNSAE